MLVEDFDYYLPESSIAQKAIEPRDSSRLLVLDRKAGSILDKVFTDIISYLSPGDLLVMNDTRVIPARLLGEKKGTRGRAEVLLLREIEPSIWEALVKPGARLKEGAHIVFGGGLLEARIEKHLEEGLRLVRFKCDRPFMEILDELGQMPLPPYISSKLEDKERYQTVYSKNLGSAAAPTAGLHFTKKLLQTLSEKGVNIAYVTLHVGLGTFRPVSEKTIENHKMHSEVYQVPTETWEKVQQTKKARGKVVAVGTTVVRTLEASAESGRLFGETAIFIYPGYEFKIVDSTITNFHLPKSTLLMLVSAFADRENILKAYEHAVANNYRFYSFGDAMLIT